MSLELKRSESKIVIYGKEYKVQRPTVRQVRSLQVSTANKTDEERFVDLQKWVAGLGVPIEVLEDMEMEHFTELVAFLSGSKKN